MKRNIISIDEEKCNGCGLCVDACHEGALQMVDGKAKLVSESYCDGLGDCLPQCPTGAITIEEREAEEFDEKAVLRNMEAAKKVPKPSPCACPSVSPSTFDRKTPCHAGAARYEAVSELRQWPCQLQLVPINAPFFDNARLLIAADCTAFANAQIHARFMRGKITLIGCPKLDNADYAEKLTKIIKYNDIKSVEVLRMSVPCCGGIENAIRRALSQSGKTIPWRVTVIGVDGSVCEDY